MGYDEIPQEIRKPFDPLYKKILVRPTGGRCIFRLLYVWEGFLFTCLLKTLPKNNQGIVLHIQARHVHINEKRAGSRFAHKLFTQSWENSGCPGVSCVYCPLPLQFWEQIHWQVHCPRNFLTAVNVSNPNEFSGNKVVCTSKVPLENRSSALPRWWCLLKTPKMLTIREDSTWTWEGPSSLLWFTI